MISLSYAVFIQHTCTDFLVQQDLTALLGMEVNCIIFKILVCYTQRLSSLPFSLYALTKSDSLSKPGKKAHKQKLVQNLHLKHSQVCKSTICKSTTYSFKTTSNSYQSATRYFSILQANLLQAVARSQPMNNLVTSN